MSYIIIFITVLFFIIAYIVGFYHTLKKVMKRNIINRKRIKPNKRNIQECFTDDGDSFSDLICEVEGEDEQLYIENNRKKQNNAYNYVKEKKTK